MRQAERRSSGEIRVVVARFYFWGDVWTAAAQAFGKLGMTRTRRRNGVLISWPPGAAVSRCWGTSRSGENTGDVLGRGGEHHCRRVPPRRPHRRTGTGHRRDRRRARDLVPARTRRRQRAARHRRPARARSQTARSNPSSGTRVVPTCAGVGVGLAILGVLVGAMAGQAAAAPAAAAVEAGASPPVTPLMGAPPAGPPAIPVRYVGSLDGLEASMKSDSLLHPRAQSIADRRVAGIGVLVGGVRRGCAVHRQHDFPRRPGLHGLRGPPELHAVAQRRRPGGGLLVTSASLVAGLAIAPSAGEMSHLVNDWNARHPDQPYAFLPGSLTPHHHHHH